MYTIKENIKNTLIINKSRFITHLIKVYSVSECLDNLNSLKEEYKDANHYCYAYIINGIKRFNDDGEPSGTAGLPILNVLESSDLNFVLCVVIRYFGGIKLGAGGLVRAYRKSTTNSLINGQKIELVKGKKISITFKYDNVKVVDKVLEKVKILEKIFNETIKYTLLIPDNNIDIINEDWNPTFIENVYIEKDNI
ncbi:MAG: YigZ family protein [Bacilli bacterium]